MTKKVVPRRLNGSIHFFHLQINGPLFIVTGRLKQQYHIIMYYYYTANIIILWRRSRAGG